MKWWHKPFHGLAHYLLITGGEIEAITNAHGKFECQLRCHICGRISDEQELLQRFRRYLR